VVFPAGIKCGALSFQTETPTLHRAPLPAASSSPSGPINDRDLRWLGRPCLLDVRLPASALCRRAAQGSRDDDKNSNHRERNGARASGIVILPAWSMPRSRGPCCRLAYASPQQCRQANSFPSAYSTATRRPQYRPPEQASRTKQGRAPRSGVLSGRAAPNCSTCATAERSSHETATLNRASRAGHERPVGGDGNSMAPGEGVEGQWRGFERAEAIRSTHNVDAVSASHLSSTASPRQT
jgi:hypothetical protein